MSAGNRTTKIQERYGTERLNALTDGVAAIALTLLVLGIDIPSDHNFSEDGLKRFLLKLEPGLVAYATSFIVIAVYWNIHHRMYNVVRFANNAILVFNTLFLFSISLIPFIAKIKSLYRFDALVVILFASAHIVTGLILLATWKHFMSHRELLKYPIADRKSKLVAYSIMTISIVSSVAILVAFINVHIGTYLFFLIPICYVYIYRLSEPLFQDNEL